MATKYSEQVQTTIANNNPYVRKNLIINGGFDFWQRTEGVTQNLVAGSTSFSADRFAVSVGAATAGAADVVRSTAKQTGGFNPYGLRINCTTADTSTSTGEQVTIRYRIEGTDIRHIMGKVCTLSFWIRSNLTGTYCVSFSNTGVDRVYIAEYTINESLVWEYKTITFTMHDGESGTWNFNPDTVGLNIRWALVTGSDFRTSSPNTWLSSVTAYSTNNQVNFFNSTANLWNIRDIQFELGPVATPFEFRPYDQELSLCERYCQVIQSGSGSGASTTAAEFGITFTHQMSGVPTVGSVSAPMKIEDPAVTGYTQSTAAATIQFTSKYGTKLVLGNFTGLTAGKPYLIRGDGGYVVMLSEI